MWGMYYLPDPKLNELWCTKGDENNESANYYELIEKRDDPDGPSYKLMHVKSGKDMGWFSLEVLRKYYAPWNDPWQAQRAWAKLYGFAFKIE